MQRQPPPSESKARVCWGVCAYTARLLFEWMARTRLAPLVASEDGGAAVVFEDPAEVADDVSRAADAADVPEIATAVANTLSDAAGEAQWRDRSLAAVLP